MATRVLIGVEGVEGVEARARVRDALLALDGVTSVDVGADGQTAVEYVGARVTVMEMLRALRGQGFRAGME